MMDPQTAYYFKKFYRNIIKWWFVAYNPDVKKIWPSKEEEEAAHKKELEALATNKEAEPTPIEEEAYNETTGSFSGLYGKGPMDDHTQSMLAKIMNLSSSQSSIDSILQNSSEFSNVTLPPEQEEVIKEANVIYERLLREAKEDEDRKTAEVEAAKKQ